MKVTEKELQSIIKIQKIFRKNLCRKKLENMKEQN